MKISAEELQKIMRNYNITCETCVHLKVEIEKAPRYKGDFYYFKYTCKGTNDILGRGLSPERIYGLPFVTHTCRNEKYKEVDINERKEIIQCVDKEDNSKEVNLRYWSYYKNKAKSKETSYLRYFEGIDKANPNNYYGINTNPYAVKGIEEAITKALENMDDVEYTEAEEIDFIEFEKAENGYSWCTKEFPLNEGHKSCNECKYYHKKHDDDSCVYMWIDLNKTGRVFRFFVKTEKIELVKEE